MDTKDKTVTLDPNKLNKITLSDTFCDVKYLNQYNFCNVRYLNQVEDDQNDTSDNDLEDPLEDELILDNVTKDILKGRGLTGLGVPPV